MGSPSNLTTNASQLVNAVRGTYPGGKGRLVALPTKIELQLSCQTIEVFVATVPLKSANTIFKLVQAAIQDTTAASLQHLKRFVKPENLPMCLRCFEEIPRFTTPVIVQANPSTLPVDRNGASTGGSQGVTLLAVSGSAKASKLPVLHYLVCPASVINVDGLGTIFCSIEVSLGIHFNPQLRLIPVPLYPPTSEKQAKDWSRAYWPTVYKGGNPFGPHPSLVSRSQEDVRGRAARCMSLARRAGEEVTLAGQGEPVGAVIVDHSRGEGGSVIVVAGDARWRHIDKAGESGNGNVTAHAVMRAIGMVARKRRALLHEGLVSGHCTEDSNLDADRPLTALEREVYTTSPVSHDGYLCLDLELYVTHEPCVMCSMAILHSRFSRVIFGQRMLRTGGLTAVSQNKSSSLSNNESHGLGYGLFWRQELNWRHLAWQWVAEDEYQVFISTLDIHV